ncbi:hypothetical protein E2C01_037750 [Portunus trituberculatus]|uniref:Uncharacterized protein n=1 Tax=Portunus trituberculatus TaxID=210409 RepID=A0A5B7FEX6_PORTR|nr:hypothetical protein [Portunus trituberculatus]
MECNASGHPQRSALAKEVTPRPVMTVKTLQTRHHMTLLLRRLKSFHQAINQSFSTLSNILPSSTRAAPLFPL